jgi:hypothetical protein
VNFKLNVLFFTAFTATTSGNGKATARKSYDEKFQHEVCAILYTILLSNESMQGRKLTKYIVYVGSETGERYQVYVGSDTDERYKVYVGSETA